MSVFALPGKPTRRQQTTATFVGQEIQVVGRTPRGNGVLNGVLSYSPVGEGFSKDANGKIVLRRIAYKTQKANLKYKSLPRVPVPFAKKKHGWFDFVYMDENVKVTRDNKGGTFVHMRSDYLDQLLEENSLRVPYSAAARLAYLASNEKSMPFSAYKKQYENDAVADVKVKRNDIAVEHGSAAINAYMASNRKMSYALFKEQYEAEARSTVMSKGDLSVNYDAAAMLAYIHSDDRSMSFEDFKAKYEEDAIAQVKAKQKVPQLAK